MSSSESSRSTPTRPIRPATGAVGPRLVWMDELRGWAILLVVAFHGRTVLRRFSPEVPEGLAQLTAFFAPFRMPLLIFLSGMLLGRSLAKPAATYALGKARGIGWPYLVWSALFLAVAGRASGDELVAVLWSPPSYLWYLPYLLAYYAIAWALRALHVPFAVAAAVALGASAVVDGTASRFSFLFAFFVAGHVYLEHRHRVDWGARRAWACVTGAVALAGGLASAAGADLKYEPRSVVVPAAGIALCLLLAPDRTGGPVSGALAHLGRQSLVFYVSHFVTLWAVHSRWAALGVDEPVLAYVLGVCVALAVGLGLARSRRWRLVDALFRFPEPRPRGRQQNATWSWRTSATAWQTSNGSSGRGHTGHRPPAPRRRTRAQTGEQR